MTAGWRPARLRILRTLVLVILGWFFLVPVVRLSWLSLTGTEESAGLGLTQYRAVLADSRTWKATVTTLQVSVISTAVAVVLGVALAWLVAYTNVRGKRLLPPLIVASFVLPPYVVTLGWVETFGLDGLGSAVLGALPFDLTVNLYSRGGIAFVLAITHFPIVYLLVVGALRRIPHEIEQAARVCGAGRWTALFRVTLPAAGPAIGGGAVLAFLTSLDNFGVPAFLGIPAHIEVLSTRIYSQIVGFGPQAFARAAALSVLLALIAAGALLLQWWLTRGSGQAEPVAADRTPRVRLHRSRLPVEILTWGGLLVVVCVPAASMILASLRSAVGVPVTLATASVDNYSHLLANSGSFLDAAAMSVRLAVLATLACLVIGTAVAYIRARRPSRLARVIEGATALPYALPGIVMGLALILAWVQPLPRVYPGIYGTWIILWVAYVTRFTFYEVRSASATFAQLGPSVEEAARASGAGPVTAWRRILLPLAFQGLAAGAGLVLLTSLAELTVSSVLYSAQAKTIGVVIFSFQQAGNSNLANAGSALVLAVYAVAGGVGYTASVMLRRRREQPWAPN